MLTLVALGCLVICPLMMAVMMFGMRRGKRRDAEDERKLQ